MYRVAPQEMIDAGALGALGLQWPGLRQALGQALLRLFGQHQPAQPTCRIGQRGGDRVLAVDPYRATGCLRRARRAGFASRAAILSAGALSLVRTAMRLLPMRRAGVKGLALRSLVPPLALRRPAWRPFMPRTLPVRAGAALMSALGGARTLRPARAVVGGRAAGAAGSAGMGRFHCSRV